MNKTKIAGGLVAAALLLSPLATFAASISNPLFSNGQTSTDVTGGATVSGTFTLTVGPGEVVEWLRTQSDPSQPFVDTSVGGTLGYQEQVYTGIPFSVKVPQNASTVYPTIQGAGIFGGSRAINGGDNVVLGATGLGTVRITAIAPPTSGGSTGSTKADWEIAFDKLQASFEKLLERLNAGNVGSTPAPTKPAYCTGLATFAWLNFGMSGAGGLQSFLISNGFSIPAGATGYYGMQTSAAHSAAKANCN